MDIWGLIISVPLAFAAIKVVRDYSEVEELLYHLPDEDREWGHLSDDDSVLDAPL